MINYINNIRTVNGGVVKEISIGGVKFFVELLGPAYSRHKDNICCYYDKVDDVNVEVAVSKQNSEWYFEIYRFKENSIHSYYSKRYLGINRVPDKYKAMALIVLNGYAKNFYVYSMIRLFRILDKYAHIWLPILLLMIIFYPLSIISFFDVALILGVRQIIISILQIYKQKHKNNDTI